MKVLIILIPQLISLAYLTLGERKIMGSMQRRKGPSRVGVLGILQPIVDGVKLLIKETILITGSNKILFILSPIMTLILSIITLIVIPYNKGRVLIEMENSILYIILISSLGILSIILAGWASNSKYAIIGSLRTTAQMISYEIILSVLIIDIILITESLNLQSIVEYQRGVWLIMPLSCMGLVLIIGGIAETNRAPMDLPEAESELVAGYQTEHSSMIFAYFFMGEYSNIITFSILIILLLFGGYRFLEYKSSIILGIKTSIIIYIFIWVRASLPRMRYDQLILLMWEDLLPLVLGWLIMEMSIMEII